MAKHFLIVTFVIVALGLIFPAYCQTHNQLQSARVFNGFSLGMLAVSQKYTDVDDMYRYTDSVFTYNVRKFKEYSGYPYYFRNGIRNRVEISYTGFYFPLFGAFIELGLKVKIYEYGELSLFKNITVALSGNIFSVYDEWDKGSEKWGGLIVSTTHRFKSVEIEIVLEPFYSNYEGYFDHDSYRSEIRMESFNLSSGLVTRLDFNPENRFSFEIKAGFNWQHVFDSHYQAYLDNYSFAPTKVNRKILHHSDEFLNGNNFGGNASIAFNWLKKKLS